MTTADRCQTQTHQRVTEMVSRWRMILSCFPVNRRVDVLLLLANFPSHPTHNISFPCLSFKPQHSATMNCHSCWISVQIVKFRFPSFFLHFVSFNSLFSSLPKLTEKWMRIHFKPFSTLLPYFNTLHSESYLPILEVFISFPSFLSRFWVSFNIVVKATYVICLWVSDYDFCHYTT